MLIVGLTGSTGCGKGYVSKILKNENIPCLDTDIVCRLVYQKGQPCYNELVDTFGDGILAFDGEIDRSALFNVTFPYPDKYKLLNEIAFRHILDYTNNWLSQNKTQGIDVSVIDAPMLFESGFNKMCDKTVAVIADRETQISRVIKRDGIDEKKASERLEKQKDNSFYIENCDFVIDNSESNGDNVKADAIELARDLRKIAADSL